jgi:hypothetical protein
MKKCNKCQRYLDKSKFSPCSGGNYLRPECRECGYKLAKVRKKIREEQGKPPEDYLCPICLQKENELLGTGGRAGVWVVDHNEITNKFRSHLCHNCNRGIGNFRHDIDRLWRAIEYLMEHDNNDQTF